MVRLSRMISSSTVMPKRLWSFWPRSIFMPAELLSSICQFTPALRCRRVRRCVVLT